MSHAKLSPSARHRWGACPASVREEARYPEGKSGAAAVDGTHTHTLLEQCLKNNASVESMIGMVLYDHEGSFIVDKERAERVQFALDYIAERVSRTGGRIYAEQKVDPAVTLGRDDMSGTVDVVIHSPEVMEIIDYKDGSAEVSAYKNPQMEQYAWGLVPTANPKTVRVTIIQPKLRAMGREGISFYEVTREVFLEGKDEIIRQAAATDAPDAPYIPGESQCKYCAHAGNCSARTNHMLSKSGITFGPSTVLEQTMSLSVTDLTTDRIREIVEALPMLRGWLDSVEEAALERIKSGTPIDGLKIVRGRGMRSWAFPEEEIAEKLRKMTVPKSVIWKTAIISPAAAEKLKWQSGEKQKQLSVKQLKVLKEEMILKGEGKLTVVSAADERQAVEFGNVEAMFAEADALPSWLIS